VAPPAAAQPKPTGAAGSVIQLGAFANQAQAERAWTALSARFPSIAAMNKIIVPFPGGIRLRAGAGSPGEAKQACDMLKAAGENCFVAQ
jgi:cell division septation protein DedD